MAIHVSMNIMHLSLVSRCRATTQRRWTRFRAALDRHEFRPAVQHDVAVARERDVRGAPVFFVNGKRVDGIEPSDDPLLELRAAIYLLSGRRRRQVPATRSQVSSN